MNNKQIIVNVEGLTLEEKQRVNEALANIKGIEKITASLLNSVIFFAPGTYSNRVTYLNKGQPDESLEPTHTPQQVLEMAGMNTKPHPHLAAIKAFYEAAKVSDKPWESIQIKRLEEGSWSDCVNSPSWSYSHEYRAKPKTRMIHGVEVPVFDFIPKNGDKYYFAGVSYANYCTDYHWSSDIEDKRFLERGLVYPFTTEGKSAAILHAKAMLGIAHE